MAGAGRTTYRQISTWHAAPPQPSVSPQHKVILLGVAGVGKTAFFLRVRDDVFRHLEATCCPADYLVRTVPVPCAVCTDVTSLKIILYDTAGGEKFRSLTSNFFKNAHAAILMFSVNDVVSFYKMEQELENARPFLERDFVWVVVGNKSDLTRDPHITEERVEAFCASLGTKHWLYVSAKTGEGVGKVLEVVATELHRARHSTVCKSVQESQREDTVQILSVEQEQVEREEAELDKKGCRPQPWSCS